MCYHGLDGKGESEGQSFLAKNRTTSNKQTQDRHKLPRLKAQLAVFCCILGTIVSTACTGAQEGIFFPETWALNRSVEYWASLPGQVRDQALHRVADVDMFGET